MLLLVVEQYYVEWIFNKIIDKKYFILEITLHHLNSLVFFFSQHQV